MSGTLVRSPAPESRPPARALTRRGPLRWWRDPWRRPRMLASLTWAFLIWSIAPVAIAILFSFNAGRANDVWQGFSMRWYYGDPVLSVWHDPACANGLRTKVTRAAPARLGSRRSST